MPHFTVVAWDGEGDCSVAVPSRPPQEPAVPEASARPFCLGDLQRLKWVCQLGMAGEPAACEIRAGPARAPAVSDAA